ncbi:MAG: hypothetical protein ACI9EF_003548 [Pseudohongiellaceae bacterium]
MLCLEMDKLHLKRPSLASRRGAKELVSLAFDVRRGSVRRLLRRMGLRERNQQNLSARALP